MEISQIRKRDGTIVLFNKQKIIDAIWKAMRTVNEGDKDRAEEVADQVVDLLNHKFRKTTSPNVEEIQDVIEEILILNKYVKTSKAFILYRKQHNDVRRMASLMNTVETIEKYIDQADWRVKENANMTYSLQGLNNHIASLVVAEYWLDKLYPSKIANAHRNAEIHIHDLSTLGAYCVGWDLQDVLMTGFTGVEGKIQSKPAKHLRVALGQIVNYIYTLQGETAGAQAFSNFDTLLAPFVRYDGLDYQQLKQTFQEFLFNMNVPTRVGFQSLAWDELVIVKYRGNIKTIKIGELIDKKFITHKNKIINNVDGYGNKSPDSFAVPNLDDYEVLGFDNNQKANWLKVKGFVKHKVKEKRFLKIRTSKGEAKVSPAHSLFSFNSKSIKPVQPKDLTISKPNEKITKTNHVVSIGKNISHLFENKNSIDITDLINELPETYQLKIFVKLTKSEYILFEKNLKSKYPIIKQMLYDFGRLDKSTWYDLRKKQVVPFNIWYQFSNKKFNNQKFYVKPYPNNPVDRYLDRKELSAFIKLTAWYITEGKANTSSIKISNSDKENIDGIKKILKELNMSYSLSYSTGWSSKTKKKTNTRITNFEIYNLYSYLIKILCGVNSSTKHFPSFIFNINKKLKKEFLDTLIKGDGWEYQQKYIYTSKSQHLLSNISLLLSILNKDYAVSRKDKNGCYTIHIFKNDRKQKFPVLNNFEASPVYEIEEYDYPFEWEYDISVDSKTENFTGGIGLLLFHNTPFSNITMDLTPHPSYKNSPVIIGGKMTDDIYGDFQKEMNMINQVFAEAMIEGDAQGRLFTFPIPTYNITKDFDWDAPEVQKVFEMTAKYGIPYFSNFINSDMKPEDARSMCLCASENILYKEDGEIKHSTIKELSDKFAFEFDDEGWSDASENIEALSLNPETMKLEWKKVLRFVKIKRNELVNISTQDGKEFKASENHLVTIVTPNGLEEKFAKDIQIGDYILSLKDGSEILSNNIQEIWEDEKLDKELAGILGFFTADGNFLWDSRYDKRLRGIQLSFNYNEFELINEIKKLIKSRLDVEIKEKKDPRYNTYYLYIYSSSLAKKIYGVGFKKHGKLPNILFNSPKEIIKEFLNYFFKGDGYELRKEIHINDLDLSKDLVLLYNLIGISTTYKIKKNSQRIYLQHRKEDLNSLGLVSTPCLYECVPGFMAKSTYLVPGLNKGRMVSQLTLQKYDAQTLESEKYFNSDIYITRVVEIQNIKNEKEQEFYDIELEDNHLFMHSLGTITHNCCRLRLDNRELRKRGGGLFGANPLTGCYDEQTEILTEEGWIFFKDLTKQHNIFTLTDKNKIEVHKPNKLFKYDYDGELYEFKTKSLDLLVTPNHRMVVDQSYKNKRIFVEAQNLDVNNHRIPKQSIWEGEEKEWFILPSITFTKYGRQGRTPYKVIKDTLKIKMDDWLKFFGFWLAEGSTDNEKIAKKHGYRVTITQINKKKREEIRIVLDKLPFNFTEEKNNFVICNKQLWTHLRGFGKGYNKYIPKEIKNLSKRQLKLLFDWLVKGDGNIRKTTGQIMYWTTSKKLADDIQEVILKLGWLGTMTKQKKKVSKIKGREITSIATCYIIGVQKAKHYRLRKRNIKKVPYKGKVYCCEVKNHSVFVRRNGKVTWCGNSIGVVTVNLPRIGYLARTEEEYFEKLDEAMDLAYTSLEIKRKVLESFTERGLYPYSKFYLRKIKQTHNQYWKNHFSTIGLIGMNESMMNMFGSGLLDTESRNFSIKVLDYMRKKLEDYQLESGNIYNLEATPGEGTTHRLARIDKLNYPNIIVANEQVYQERNAAPYYTNSTQLHVASTIDLFDALDIEDELQTKYTGGTVFHTFLGEKVQDWKMTRELVKRIAQNFKLPYFTLTPTFSICPVHGYIAGEHEVCPKCDEEIGYAGMIRQLNSGKQVDQEILEATKKKRTCCEVYSRVVGYIRPVKQWNAGKVEEFRERKVFDKTF